MGLRLLARHWAGVGAGLPLRLPLRDPLHRAHAHRPALQLGALRLLLAVVVFALVPRVVVHVAGLGLVGGGEALRGSVCVKNLNLSLINETGSIEWHLPRNYNVTA